MSTRQTIPDQNGQQTILVTTDYEASATDRSLNVEAAGVLVTLPPNPTVGETSLEILASAAFKLSGGENPLLGDPQDVAEGDSFLIAFTATGWQKIGAGAGTLGSYLVVIGTISPG